MSGRLRGGRRPRLVLLGNFGIGNLGNDASLEAVVASMRRSFPSVDLVCVCPRPDGVARRIGVDVADLRAPRPTAGGGPAARLGHRLRDVVHCASVLRGADAVLVPGTGILDDYRGERGIGWPLTLLQWVVVARVRGVPTALLSIGAGPFRDARGRRFIGWTTRLAAYCSVRDVSSRDFVAGLRPTRHGARHGPVVVPDLVFSLPAPAPGRSGPPARGPAADGDRGEVVVAVMHYTGWYAGADPATVSGPYEATLARLASRLLSQDRRVVLLTADAKDADATRRVESLVLATSTTAAAARLSVRSVSDYAGLVDAVSSAAVVVATRYHTLVAALACARPTVSVGYGSKNEDLMTAAGLGTHCQHVDRLDADLLCTQVSDLLAEGERATGVVGPRVAGFRIALGRQSDAVARLIRPQPVDAR